MGAVVVAQFVERLLPISEVCGAIMLNIYCQLYWKDENKEKETANGPFKKTLC